MNEALALDGHQRRVARIIGQFSIAPFIVAQSDLVCAFPRRMAEAAARLLPLALLPMPVKVPPIPIRQIWHRRQNADPRHRWARDLLSRSARRLA